MEEREPVWYEQLKKDPAPGKTLPTYLIRRIEEKAAEREARPGWRRPVWISALSLAMLVVCWLAVPQLPERLRPMLPTAPAPAATYGPDPIVAMPTPDTASPSPTPPSSLYRLKGFVDAMKRPESFSGMTPVFTAYSGQDYLVANRSGKFVAISNGIQTGWIPEWYLDTEHAGDQVMAVVPYEMLIAKSVIFSLYPGETEPSGFELWPWKVVQVTKEYGDWAAVTVKTYDSPYFGDKWVPKAALTAYDPAKAKEGVMKKGALVFDENGKEKGSPSEGASIYIEGESKGRYRIIAAGGYGGFIDKKDFVPNPFVSAAVGGDWLLTADKAKRYNAFAAKRNDELLKDLEPLDLFRFYVNASLAGDAETLYSLYIRGQEYGTPSLETFLKDLAADPEGVERQRLNWEGWKQAYRLEQWIEGDTALIVLIPKDRTPAKGNSAAAVKEDEKGFGLTKNKAGIWKVNWQPMQ